jgi:hypothetical protein
MTRPPLVLEHALACAARGWRVHPCRAKRALLSGWPERASTTPAQLAAWWREYPDANIGIATGPESGLLVLDVDGDPDELLADRPRPRTPTQQTGGGGWQYLYRFPPALAEARTTRAGVLPGVDTRGRGGYIIAPPSLHPSGRCYAWAPGAAPDDVPCAEPPGWLVDLLTPPARPECTPTPLVRPVPAAPRARRYVQRAIEYECDRVARAREGTRNDTLNLAAYSLARFIVAGEADAECVVRALTYAALECGLGEREITRTLDSALGARRVA